MEILSLDSHLSCSDSSAVESLSLNLVVAPNHGASEFLGCTYQLSYSRILSMLRSFFIISPISFQYSIFYIIFSYMMS